MGIFSKKPRLANYRMPDERNPVCPHCEREIDGLMSRQVDSALGKALVWTCPRCLVVLGVAHRQGYILDS